MLNLYDTQIIDADCRHNCVLRAFNAREPLWFQGRGRKSRMLVTAERGSYLTALPTRVAVRATKIAHS